MTNKTLSVMVCSGLVTLALHYVFYDTQRDLSLVYAGMAAAWLSFALGEIINRYVVRAASLDR